MSFPHESVRDFISELEERGELLHVKQEVDWNLEAPAIARRISEVGLGRSVNNGGLPAPLFEKIRGYPEGFRMVSNLLGTRERVALAMGHPDPENATFPELQDIFLEAMEHPVKPVVVETGPCKENRMTDDEVNLYKFPAPFLHEGDGGRYIATWHITATKDPDSDWMNWGTPRVMLINRNTMSGLVQPGSHTFTIMNKYAERKQPTPFAIALGTDLLSTIGAPSPAPYGISEVDVIGGMRKKPVELVKCDTNDLLVPASSEIVIEGVMPAGLTAWEGPFGEYTGYRASPRDRRPVYQVKAITWRNDPILPFFVTGVPVADDALAMQTYAAVIKKALLAAGLPVTAVHLPPEASLTLLVVATKTPVHGIAHVIRDVAHGAMHPPSWRKLLVVNDDIDIFNPVEVLHAFSTRVNPVTGEHISYEPANPLTPFASYEDRLNCRAPACLYDGTWPLDWDPAIAVPPRSAFASIYPGHVQEKVVSRWAEYGFPQR